MWFILVQSELILRRKDFKIEFLAFIIFQMNVKEAVNWLDGLGLSLNGMTEKEKQGENGQKRFHQDAQKVLFSAATN